MNIEQGLNGNNYLNGALSELDVDLVGICDLSHWKETKVAETALKLLPEAHSVVVLAMEIYGEVLDLSVPKRVMGEAAMGDLLTRNMDFLNGRLTKAAHDIAKISHKVGLKVLPLPAAGCPIDARFLEAVFSYKHAGQCAGLGKIGWHSLLITPDFGSRVRLACCLTEAELKPTDPHNTIECDGCGRCLASCPAGALSQPQDGELYSINKFACLTFRNASGGCSECMRVCPLVS